MVAIKKNSMTAQGGKEKTCRIFCTTMVDPNGCASSGALAVSAASVFRKKISNLLRMRLTKT
jgi:hypothetical protein